MSHVAFLQSEITALPPEKCRYQVIPVPYEATVSYGGGTKNGPAAIIEASGQLEAWTGRSLPLRHGIYTWPEVDCAGQAEKVLDNIESAVSKALEHGPSLGITGNGAALPERESACNCTPCLPVVLGGEHTVTLGVLRALRKRYGHFGVIQFDAHADLRQSYEGSIYSHACVMRRAVDDLGLDLFQFGVRSLSVEEVEFRAERGIKYLDARQAMFPLPGGLPSASAPHGASAIGSSASRCDSLSGLLPADFPEQVFLTFDIDALDASLMPSTGTPEPGGLFWWDALRLIEASLSGRRCIGFDVVELAPQPGLHAPNFTAARLVYEIMGMFG